MATERKTFSSSFSTRSFFESVYLVMHWSDDCNDKKRTMVLLVVLVMHIFPSLVPYALGCSPMHAPRTFSKTTGSLYPAKQYGGAVTGPHVRVSCSLFSNPYISLFRRRIPMTRRETTGSSHRPRHESLFSFLVDALTFMPLKRPRNTPQADQRIVITW